jgi:hypothetical protein
MIVSGVADRMKSKIAQRQEKNHLSLSVPFFS